MLAVVKETKGSNYALKDVDMPMLKDNELLVKVKAVGICGSDLPIFKGLREVPLPLILGHEFAGDVVEVGKGVKNFKIGDRVTSSIVRNCGQCYFCQNNLETLCDNIIETGIHVDGAFAEYVAIPVNDIHLLPNNMTYEEGASIDPIASAYHGFREINVDNKNVAILGPGAIGLYAMQIAKLKGASKVITIGRMDNDDRLAVAKELGSDGIINHGKENLFDSIHTILDGELPDIVIDATGSTDGLGMSIKLVRKKGIVVLLGIPSQASLISIGDVVRKEIQIRGSICYTKKEFEDCISLVDGLKIKTEPIVSHRFDLKDIEKALKVIMEEDALKVMLFP